MKKKRIRLTLYLLINGSNCLKIRIFLEIADSHIFGTEYARDMKVVSKYVVLDTLLYSSNNSI